MTAAASSAEPASAPVRWEGDELVVTRVLPAPPALVFTAWTRPEHFAAWWGPRGSTLEVRRLDARPGGAIHYRHGFDDHEDVWIAGVYRAVQAPGRLAFSTWFSDRDGGRVERAGYPPEMTITLTFAPHPEGTLLTARHAGLPGDNGEVQGWTESLDRLAAVVAGLPTPQRGSAPMFTTTPGTGPAPASTDPDNREATATRVFHAPRALVFEAMTNPAHVARWYGPRGTQLTACEIDLRPGGRFRFVMSGPGGAEIAFSGEYQEVVRPERVVNTWVFEPYPDSPALEKATWEEQDGQTTVRLSIRFRTVEDYAGWAGSGAFGGWAETLDRLAEVIAALGVGEPSSAAHPAG